MRVRQIEFPKFSGIRCLMMPYVQGDPSSVPDEYAPYRSIIKSEFIREGDIGFLTIDEMSIGSSSELYLQGSMGERVISPKIRWFRWVGAVNERQATEDGLRR